MTDSNIFRWAKGWATIFGARLAWDVRYGLIQARADIYGTKDGKEWYLIQPGVKDHWCDITRENTGLTTAYRIRITCTNGEQGYSDSIQPQTAGKQSWLIWKEIRRREEVLMRAHPFGAVRVYILMRRANGNPCPLCNPDDCWNSINPSCPSCFGTGIEDGYYIWPEKEPMLMLEPKDDKIEGTQENQRNIVNRSFRTVFDGRLREHDLLLVANAFYDIMSQQVAASVADIPAVYLLATKQLAPEEPRYKALWKFVAANIGEPIDECN